MSDSAGLRFECTRCGMCCTHRNGYAHVYLNRDEVKALAEHLELSVRAFKRRYTFVDEYGWTQLETEGERCVFLDPDTMRCNVYEARPTQCRTFPFWRDNVRDGRWTADVRRHCEGIGRGRLYTIEEAEVRMVEMEESEED